MMTEAEAWREIAKEFVERPKNDMACSGLCNALWELRWDGRIEIEVRDKMRERVKVYLGDWTWAYETDSNGNPRKADKPARCLAALWLAEEAEHETAL